MMEMHIFQKAKQLEISSPNGETAVTAQNLFAFLYEISEWIQAEPFIYRRGHPQTDTVYVRYDDIVFAEEDFWQMFGGYLTLLYTRWKIDLFGTADFSQETVWLTLEEEKHRIYAVQKTLSGHPSDVIQSLCLRIQCTSPKQSEILQALLAAANWKNGVAALDWKYSSFLLEENLALPTQNSCFCYGSILEDIRFEDLLQALDLQQKITLWTDFLKDGFDHTEFEWLYGAISQGAVGNRIEWELSLHAAMQGLGYTVQASPNDFELYDGYGCRRYFSFNSTSYAERAFLKILFPLTI